MRPRERLYLARRPRAPVLYHFELQLAGVILLTAMAAGAVSLWLKRRREAGREAEGGEPPGPA